MATTLTPMAVVGLVNYAVVSPIATKKIRRLALFADL